MANAQDNEPDELEDDGDLNLELESDGKVSYDSASMNARRKRILSQARAMIAEEGYQAFNVRALAKRAGVAQRTLYNAFGSKDYIIATAIQQYHADFHTKLRDKYSAETLIGRLERLIKVRKRELEIKNYTAAIMQVYNSEQSDSVIRHQFRDIMRRSLRPLVDTIVRMDFFASGVTPEQFTERVITCNYASLSDWCNGTVADDYMVRDAVETFLIVLVGMTSSAIQVEGNVWLADIRANGRLWQSLNEEVDAGLRENAGKG